MPQHDVLKMLLNNEERLKQTETRETPGNIPGFTSFYATGSFNATLVGAGTAGTFTYTSQLVEWSRVGNRLHYNGRISISATAVAPVGAMSINGWPYAGVTSGAISGIGAMMWATITLPAGYTTVALQFSTTTSAGLVRSGTAVGLVVVVGADLTGGIYDLRFGGNYKVA